MYESRPRHDPQELERELARFGAPTDVIERVAARETQETVEIHADNLETVALFSALATQWRHAGMTGIRVGLDYRAIPPTAQAMGIELTRELFEGLRVMESEALKVMREAEREA